MKTPTLRLAFLVIVAVLIMGSVGCFRTRAARYRTVVVRPAKTIVVPIAYRGGALFFNEEAESQTVMVSSNATFSVSAVRLPGFDTNGVSYQWQKNPVQLNGDLYFTNMPGEINPKLAITNAQISDVAYYRAIAYHGIFTNISIPVPLVVCYTGSTYAVGTPVVGTGLGQWCTTHKGYVLYPDLHNSQGGQGYIVVNPGVAGSAKDIQSTSTRNEADGNQYGEGYCGGSGAVSVPSPILSTTWGFTIWFPSYPVPTGNYTNKLTNFIP